MGKEYDFQTVDMLYSKHAVNQAMKLVVVLRNMVMKPGLTSAFDVAEWTGLTRRSAQRYLKQFEQCGLVTGDSRSPQGFKVTDKTKQLFSVKIIQKGGDNE